ncbi:MAG: hypothetical protein JRJ73_13505 [Deltaproteobacteria bacterium]|nr:hypothetical protein [Deltaproteobacteria bacterium]MBW2052805.1 hypothetical protein [Deltaproteobacteria bacterium]
MKDTLHHKPAQYRVASVIAGTKESIETKKLMLDWLREKYRENQKTFNELYVRFCIVDEDAKVDVSDLLYDWCHFSKLGKLVDKRDFVEKVLLDYAGESLDYPVGKSFYLLINTCSSQNVLSKLFSKPRFLSILIDTQDVTKLEGTFEDFKIYMGQLTLSFSRKSIHVQLCP